MSSEKIIGIMCAMPQEGEAIKSLMENDRQEIVGGTLYTIGTIEQIPTILAIPDTWGSTEAAEIATTLIVRYSINKLIFTGVAGSLSPEIGRGSIIIAEKLYYHDVSVCPLLPEKCHLGPKGPKFFEATPTLVEQVKQAADDFLKNISADFLLQCFVQDPRVIIGVIATGNRFIASKNEIQTILEDTPNACAVEMEGAAVAQVCRKRGIDFAVSRIISDLADGAAPEHFAELLHFAGEFSKGIIEGIYRVGWP